MKVKCLSLFLLLLCFAVNAQKSDSLQIHNLINEAFGLLYSEPEEARRIANQALKGSQELSNCLLQAKSKNIIGIIYDVTNEYDSALSTYGEVIELSDACGLEVMKGQVLNNIGLIYWNTGEYDRAINYYTQSLKIFEKHDKQKGVANTLSNIGLLYREKEERDNSDIYHRRALKIRKEIKDWYGVSVSYSNIANNYLYHREFDSARVYLTVAAQIKDTLEDLHGLAIVYNNLGIISHEEGKNDSAVYFMNQAIKIRRSLGQKSLEASDHFSLAYFFLDEEDYAKAYHYLDTAHTLAAEGEAKSLLAKIYKRYARLDTLVGDYARAVNDMEKYFELSNEISSVEKEKAFAEIQAEYQAEKKERQLAEKTAALAQQELKVKQRTTWAVVLLVILAFLVISAIYVYRQQKIKQNQLAEEARLKEELARAEVNSKIQEERVRISRDLHDHIGSQLTIISSAIDNIAFSQKDENLKKNLLEISDNGRNTMSQLRETIWAMNKKVIDLDTLVAKTREFVSRLKLDDQKVNVQAESDEELDLSPALAINLFRIVQEATNNAVKYADFAKLEIRFVKLNGSLTVKVEDDGKGFSPAGEIERGFGLVSMQERAKHFGGNLQIISNEGTGTQVQVSISLYGANYV